MSYNFPNYITENQVFLEKLSKTKSRKKFEYLLSNATSEQILAITEIVHNILKGNCQLRRSRRIKLAKNADYYRKIARSKTEKGALKNIQSGGQLGVLGAVLAPILSILSQSILDKALKK